MREDVTPVVEDSHSTSEFFASFGQVDPSLQRYDCSANSLEELLRDVIPPSHNPFSNWASASPPSIDPSNVLSWFPDDDFTAFYAPSKTEGPLAGAAKEAADGSCLEALSYRQLREEIRACPPWRHVVPSSSAPPIGLDESPFVMAVLLPPEMMTETAIVLLSIMCGRGMCAAPLDPRMPPKRTLEALLQLRCWGIVSTLGLLEDMGLRKPGTGFVDPIPASVDAAVDDTNDLDVLRGRVLEQLMDIRTIEPRQDRPMAGGVSWLVLRHTEHVDGNATPQENNWNGSSTARSPKKPPVLMLRTSGTTSVPKVVPLLAEKLLYNAVCIAASLKLSRNDIDCNAMPFYHIGGISAALLAVLVSGSSVIMNGPFANPGEFLDRLVVVGEASEERIYPTWYYGVPTMHKALLITARYRLATPDAAASDTCEYLPTKLRFVRSGAAHLSHEVALELSKLFRTRVLPTYSMSECMPICSSRAPVEWDAPCEAIDTVGVPIGASLCIVNGDGRTVAHSDDAGVGEVAIRGTGVMDGYIGGGTGEEYAFTPDGWLLTGDMGTMDRDGRVYLKGRTKEMIKRGGEQVWPNMIDDVICRVRGVDTAIAFGVPNQLWGEEVAVAVVVTREDGDGRSESEKERQMKEQIILACQKDLDEASVPAQIIFVASESGIPKGPTGKYLRREIANHFGVTAADNGTLNALTAGGNVFADLEVQNGEGRDVRISPSPALNGLRFVVVCFVVQHHIGLYPNIPWLKIQSFTLNMTIFFTLAAFQLTCAVHEEVNSKWPQFVGTKLGALHALFLVTQFIALPSYVLFQCGSTGFQEQFEKSTCDGGFWAQTMVLFFFVTATGLVSENPVNPPSWFQSALYIFLMLFPWLDSRLRRHPPGKRNMLFGVNLAIATLAFLVLLLLGLFALSFSILSWLPLLVSALSLAYIFKAQMEESVREDDVGAASKKCNICWGHISDMLSVVFFLMEVAVAFATHDCLCVKKETFALMRPEDKYPSGDLCTDKNVRACDVTYTEFVDYIYPDAGTDDDANFGRWGTDFGGLIGFGRLATPLVVMWIYGLSLGEGFSARILGNPFLTTLAPLAYSIYLLHLPMGRYYWLLTHPGDDAEQWWNQYGLIPLPVEWYEMFAILGICVILGALLDRFVVRTIMPTTVKLGIRVCMALRRICFCCCQQDTPVDTVDSNHDSTAYKQVESMVRVLTGTDNVAREIRLSDLGLDSLGSTALLGTLRATVPRAKGLSMERLKELDTVGDLVDYLDGVEDSPMISTVAAEHMPVV